MPGPRISERDMNPIVVFEDTMDDDFFRREIMEQVLGPFIRRATATVPVR